MNISTSVTNTTYSGTINSSAVGASSQVKARQDLISYTPQTPQSTTASDPGTVTVDQNTPVQAYAIPAWMAQFGVSLNTLGSNSMSAKDRALMAADPQDLAALDERWRQHAGQVFEDAGLSNSINRYQASLESPELASELHRKFNESVMGDAQLLALMSKIGIDLLPVA